MAVAVSVVPRRTRLAAVAACLLASSCGGSEGHRRRPGNVLARPGDTLRFTVSSIGEPHTIAIGTLVDGTMAAVKKANARSVEETFLNEPPEMSVLPSVFGATAG